MATLESQWNAAEVELEEKVKKECHVGDEEWDQLKKRQAGAQEWKPLKDIMSPQMKSKAKWVGRKVPSS